MPESTNDNDTDGQPSDFDIVPGLGLGGICRPEPPPEQATVEELLRYERDELSAERKEMVRHYLVNWKSWRDVWCDALVRVHREQSDRRVVVRDSVDKAFAHVKTEYLVATTGSSASVGPIRDILTAEDEQTEAWIEEHSDWMPRDEPSSSDWTLAEGNRSSDSSTNPGEIDIRRERFLRVVATFFGILKLQSLMGNRNYVLRLLAILASAVAKCFNVDGPEAAIHTVNLFLDELGYRLLEDDDEASADFDRVLYQHILEQHYAHEESTRRQAVESIVRHLDCSLSTHVILRDEQRGTDA